MPNRKTLFMFSGQGSHYYQMGRDLMYRDEVFTDWMEEGSFMLSQMGVPSLLSIVYDSRQTDAWHNLEQTHPALVVVQYAMYQSVLARGVECHSVFGSSMGVFAAAAACGILSLNDAIGLALLQAKAIIHNCRPGGIMAVLGSKDIYEKNPELHDTVHLAGINFPNHFIISGSADQLTQAKQFLKKAQVSFQDLAVDYPFHSPLIEPAYDDFINKGNDEITDFGESRYTWVFPDNDQKNINHVQFYWDAVRHPIYFTDVIQELETNHTMNYVDLGPSGTLATFAKYNIQGRTSSKIFSILTPFQKAEENLKYLLSEIN